MVSKRLRAERLWDCLGVGIDRLAICWVRVVFFVIVCIGSQYSTNFEGGSEEVEGGRRVELTRYSDQCTRELTLVVDTCTWCMRVF